MNQPRSLLEEVRLTRRMPSPEAARKIRLAAGLTQWRMAAELGVHRVTFARWELGSSRPTTPQRLKYAELLAALQQELES